MQYIIGSCEEETVRCQQKNYYRPAKKAHINNWRIFHLQAKIYYYTHQVEYSLFKRFLFTAYI